MPLLSEHNRRKRNLVIIGAFLLLIAGATAFDLGIFAPELPVASNIVIFALFNLNLIVFLLLLILLFRNLVKVWFERRQQVIGARFKAKLVLAFLLLSVTPAALIFLIASVIARDSLLADDRREALASFLVEQQDLLSISAITIYSAGGQELVHVKDPVLGDIVTRDPTGPELRRGLGGQEVTTVRELTSGDLIEAVTPIWSPARGGDRRVLGAVVVGSHVTERLEQKVRGISTAFREYKQLKLLKNPIKGIYILLFLLMTLIVVFSFTC